MHITKHPPSLLNRRNRPKKPKTKLCAPLLVAILIFASIVTPFLRPPQTSAQEFDGEFSWVPACGTTYLGNWNWPKYLQEDTGLTGTNLNMENFDPENSSYVMFQQMNHATATPVRKIYQGFMSTQRITIGYDDVTHEMIIETTGSASTWRDFQVTSEPRGEVSSEVYQWPSGYDGKLIGPNAYATPKEIRIPQANVACVYIAKNVDYAPSWIFKAHNSTPDYGKQGEACEALAIGCWIGKAFDGVTGAFKAFGQAVITAITWLFVPQSGAVNAQVADLREFLDQKLGLIMYPFTFIVDTLQAFTTPTETWCTVESCAKDFGNFYGTPLTIDFFAFNDVSPQGFALMQNIIRASTILALIALARRKYFEVTQK